MGLTKERLTAEAYLELERSATVKHEFRAGEVFAMTSGTLDHNALALEVWSALRSFTKQHAAPCRSFTSDVKVAVVAADAYYYPDVVSTCDERDRGPLVLHHPWLIAEVLSPSSAAFDRGLKSVHYRLLPSLRQLLLLDSERVLVEQQQLDAGRWYVQTYGAGDRFTLTTPHGPLILSVDALYATTTLLP